LSTDKLVNKQVGNIEQCLYLIMNHAKQAILTDESVDKLEIPWHVKQKLQSPWIPSRFWDAEATQAVILAAAEEEFAKHGSNRR